MKILLVYPNFPETFWSFKHALKFVHKKATNPPLGLLTVASIIPEEWEKKLVDMNVMNLSDKDLRWADYVFLSAITIQKESTREVIDRCKQMDVRIVAGGPLFTTSYNEYEEIDHLVLNEAEITLPLFLEDLKNGCPKHIYTSDQWSELKKTPLPLWELINMKKYASMSIQYSRGCPYNCEFCDIPLLYGHRPRIKDKDQVIKELESLHIKGWREEVFFVDDNFIGNKKELKREVLPAVAEWMKQNRHPFTFITQASINLADDEDLIRLMVQAGFDSVFVGIETPDEGSLAECGKFINKNRDMVGDVKKMHEFGLQVEGGFIVGFDNDPVSIFKRQIKFIQNSGIVTAMVGLLNAPRGTKLHQRLEEENRLLNDVSGDNTDCTINFIPKMNREILIDGYKNILITIYSPKHYYERVRGFLKSYKPLPNKVFRFRLNYLGAFLKSILFLGIIGKERFQYWRLLFRNIFRQPRYFVLAMKLAIYGFHFRKYFEKYL